MGSSCEPCAKNEDKFEYNELARLSSMRSIKNRKSIESQVYIDLPVEMSSQILGNSKRLSESIYFSRMHKITANKSSALRNEGVKSRIQNMPETKASQMRNIYAVQEQMYLQNLKAKYIGEISDGMPNGFGKLYFENEDYLQGNFINGRCEGNGRLIKSDRSYYEGDIKNNIADGYGLYIGAQGFRYQGQWKNNMPNGYGEANHPNGNRYVGQFLNNKRNGKGTLYEGNRIYRGDFKDDKIDGNAKFEGEEGEVYDGQWKENKKHGYGAYQWPDGSSYEGSYYQDLRHGHGVLKYCTGQVYEGGWQNGEKNGRGNVRSKSQHFSGLFKDGKLVSVD